MTSFDVGIHSFTDSFLEMTILFGVRVAECFVTGTRDVRIVDRFIELALGEVVPLPVNHIIEMPDVSISGFQDIATKQVVCDQSRDTAVTGCGFFGPPERTGPQAPCSR